MKKKHFVCKSSFSLNAVIYLKLVEIINVFKSGQISLTIFCILELSLVYKKLLGFLNRHSSIRFGTFLIFIFFNISKSSGQSILTFDFAGIAGDEATSVSNSNNANISAATISRGSGLNALTNGDRFNANNWAVTSIANAVTGNDYMEFTITPSSGYQFSVSSIIINVQRSGTGPSAVALRSSVDSYTSNLDAEKTIVDNTATQSFTFTFAQSNSTSAVTYRFYMFAEATGGTGGIGDGIGNDIVVNGIVSGGSGGPQPASLPVVSNQCINSFTLGWTSPISYSTANNTMLVFAKAGSAITVGSATSSVVTYSADSDFSGSGTSYQNDPLAKCIYKGDGTSVDITGLASSTTYHFLILNVIDATSIYSTSLSSNGNTTALSPVSNADATPGSNQVAVTWLNPSSCYDEIIVLGKAGTISDTPFGYGIGTISNSNFGSGSTIGSSTVVYKGTGTAVTVSSLTNETNYCFKTFVRKGNTWSSGVEVCATPSATSGTILNPGDISIVGYDANTGGSNDLIAFVNLVDLNPGTSFIVTDNGFEIDAAGGVRDYSWGSGEGVMKLTWNGPGILPKGTVTTYETNVAITGWTKTCISDRDGSGNGCIENNFNFSTSGDQLFILQGNWTEGNYNCGTTYYGSGATACADASFSGRYISAFNGIGPGWIPTSQTPMSVSGAGNGARNSRLPRELRCFNIENTSVTLRLQYNNSSPRTGTQRTIMGNIKNIGNWTSFTAGSFALSPFMVGTGWMAGKWIGDINSNWFDCANWDNLYVPDENTYVQVGNTAINVASVSSFAPYSDEFLDIANSKDLVISGRDVVVDSNPLNILKVHGNLTISGTGVLDMSDGSSGTPDGSLYLYGNWLNLLNETEFKQGESSVYLVGSGSQTFTSNINDNETFYNLIINKPSGEVFLTGDDDITIDPLGTMTFTNGIVNTNKTTSSFVIFQNTASTTGASSNSFVNGPVQKISSSTSPFDFPIGDVLGSGINLFRPLGISPATSSNTTYEGEYNGIGYGNYTLGSGVTDVTTKEWWRLDRNSGTANTSIKLTWGAESDIPNELTSTISGLLVAHFNGTAWDSQGGINHTGNITDGTVTSTANGNVFGPFTLAVPTPQPVVLLSFNGKKIASGTVLDWVTISERNNKEFKVEKSLNGYVFQTIGSVKASSDGNRKNEYSFLDTEISTLAYYRIKQVDFDGNYSYSHVILISYVPTIQTFSIAPNPFESQLTLFALNNPDGEQFYQVHFVNTLGETIGSFDGNLININNWINSLFVGAGKGVYFLNISESGFGSPQVLKVIKE